MADGSQRLVIWDLHYKGDGDGHRGPAQVDMWRLNALDALKRHPERYVEALPEGVEPGK
jgi:hypothetical protein